MLRERRVNLKLYYFLSFISTLFFPITAWLFFYLRYLDFKEIALITAIGGLTGILFEIPTGAFADIVGRKRAIVISYILFFIAMIGIAYATTFWAFLIWAIINSLVNALISGSFEALVYDSLKSEGREEEYDNVVSKLEALTWLGLFVGGIAGGYMYYIWFRLPYFAQAILAFVGLLAALALKEPKIDTTKYQLFDILSQNIKGFHELFKTVSLVHTSLTFIVISAGYYIAASLLGISQAKEYGMDSRGVGILFSAGYIISAAISYFYPTLRKLFGVKVLVIICGIALIGSFIIAKFVGIFFGLLLIIARIASSTTFRNTRSIVLNKYISSQNRATAISTMVLLSQLPYVVLAYSMGSYIDATSPNQLAFILGILLVGVLFIIQIMFSLLQLKTS